MYLSSEQLKAALSLGKTVEQWLNIVHEEDYDVLRWLSIEKEKNGQYSVSYFEVFDEGNEDFLDVYEFSYLDPDVPCIIDYFDNYKQALTHCIEHYHCQENKFVNAGMIQEEYSNYLKTK